MLDRAGEWGIRLALLSASFLVAILMAEGLTRLFYPISDGRYNIKLDGERARGFLESGSVYRQVSNEYDALTTITDRGYRVPEVEGNPDIVFIGDSFTFGWGLADAETFVSIFCGQRQLRCANLGEPATGTARQLDNLERFLDEWGWRPREVELFVFAMTTSFSGGNDIRDNYDYGRSQRPEQASGDESDEAGFLERILSFRVQRLILQHSNLLRIAKFHWGPLLRTILVPELNEERLREALVLTGAELVRLDELSHKYGFEYQIYLLHPIQDIIRGTYTETLRDLNAMSPSPLITTGHLFSDHPESYYYSYDGHLNAKGARAVAEYLIRLDADGEVPGCSAGPRCGD